MSVITGVDLTSQGLFLHLQTGDGPGQGAGRCLTARGVLGPWGASTTPDSGPRPVCVGRRRNVNCLKNVVIWYEDHKHRCPYEPRLAELDPTFGLYTTAVWQCEAGHRYFQDLHSPLKPLSDSDPDSDKGGSEG